MSHQGYGDEEDPATDSARSASPTRSFVVTAVVLFAVALSLRPDIIGMGPIVELIQSDLGTSRTVVGLLASIPVLCIGFFSPVAAAVGRRIGSERVVTVGLLALALFGIARASAPTAWLLILLTVGSGAGIAFVQTLFPAIVRARTPDRVAVVTSIYVIGIQVGAAGSAWYSGEIGETVGWRVPLYTFGGLAAVLAVIWVVYSGSLRTSIATSMRSVGRDRRLWLSATAWLLVFTYGLQSFVYFGTSAWLAPYLQQLDWSTAAAGRAVSLLNVTGLIGTLLTPTLLTGLGTVRRVLVACGSVAVVSLIGLVLVPQAALVLSLTAGLGMGPLLPTILQLPTRVADDIDDIGSVSGIMLGVGYLLAATGPTVLGFVRDLTGSFVPVVWALAAVMSAFVLTALKVSPERLQRGVREDLERPA